MHIDQSLYQAAVDLLIARFPTTGGLAAALYTADGAVLSSVVFQPEWGGGGLCAETGALLEANKLNKRVTAVLCVSRLDAESPILIATPCGICQERLFHWGGEVEVAVPDPADSGRWLAKTLRQVQPYYWVNVFGRDP
ncbi:MAG TPA: cytidine deaminase, partial [Caldilineaceae bacterium]|nr:cytidine deaminase [Caldilineaceae bacterium]